MHHMREVAADLGTPDANKAAAAALTVARCLGLAKQAVDQTEVRRFVSGSGLRPAASVGMQSICVTV